MKSRDFCYWLQGYFELAYPNADGSVSLTDAQVQTIRNHLNMVFKHEIDPSNGSPEHNKELSKIHQGGGAPSIDFSSLDSIKSALNC